MKELTNDISIENLTKKELEQAGFKVDIVPKGFPIGGMYLMNGMTFLHLKNQYCVCVKFSDEILMEYKA